MESLVHQKKIFSINFSKARTRLCLSLHYNGDNNYLFVNGKESMFRQIIKMSTFHPNFEHEAYLLNLTMLMQKKYL